MRPRTRQSLIGGLLLVGLVCLAAPPATAGDGSGDVTPLPPSASLRLGSPVFRQGARIVGVAVLSGGKQVAAADDEKLLVWELATGRLAGSVDAFPATRRPPGAAVLYPAGWGVAATSDGKSLLALRAGTVCLCEVPQKTPPTTLLAGARDETLRAVVSGGTPDTVLGLTAKGGLVEWRSGGRSWSPLNLLSVGEKGVIAAGGGVAAAAAPDGRVRLWDAGKKAELGTIETAGVQAMALSADGKMLALSGPPRGPRPRVVEVWSVPDRKRVADWETNFSPSVLAVSPDGSLLALGRRIRNQIDVCDAKTGKVMHILPATHLGAEFLEFLPDGTGVVAADAAGVIRVWDPRTGKPLYEQPGHWGAVRAVAAVPGGGWVTASDDETARLWDATGKEVRKFLGHTLEITGMALSGDGKTLYTSSFDYTVRVWDLGTGMEIRNCKLPVAVRSLALSPDGKTLAVGLGPKQVGILDAGTLQVDATLTSNSGFNSALIFALAFTPDGLLLVRDTNETVRVWDVAKKSELRQMEAGRSDGKWLARLAVSPDGKRIASSFTSSGVRTTTSVGIWETESGKLLDTIDVKAVPQAFAFTPDGKAVVVGDTAGKVHLIDLEKKAVRRTFEGHRGPVLCLAVAPDGKTVASGGADTTVLVWDLADPAKKP